MCPSADRTDNASDNEAVFVMSNIIPQSKDNNEGVWEKLESDCRQMAQAGNELLITCGPAKFSDDHLPNGYEVIPTHTWKIVVEVPSGSGSVLSRITAQTRVIAVDIPNIEGIRRDNWQKYLVSVNQVEQETGLKFFNALPQDVAAVLKAKVDGQPMPKMTIDPVATAAKSDTPNPAHNAQQNQIVQQVVIGVVVLLLIFLICAAALGLFLLSRRKR
jgi:endonuclease G